MTLQMLRNQQDQPGRWSQREIERDGFCYRHNSKKRIYPLGEIKLCRYKIVVFAAVIEAFAVR